MLPRTLGRLVTDVVSIARPRRDTGVVAEMTGRPVASVLSPTAARARGVVYSPNLVGRADPGEIVWTWTLVADPDGQDLPVLVVGREDTTLFSLMVSVDPARAGDPDWLYIGSWDGGEQPGWVRMDNILDVPEESIRREGAVVDRSAFDQVARHLCTHYGWR